MLLNFATRLFGSSNERVVKGLRRHVDAINALESRFHPMSDDELRGQTALFREQLAAGRPLDDLTHEAFAVVREAAQRTLGVRHFDVQLMGGMVLHQGKITEMRTGEGKTLVATLPTYLNALTGKGVHVVTVNDYLARRDSGWMGRIHNFLGMSVGCIGSGMSDLERRRAYEADVTYATNNELGFDYLRDNMKFSPAEMVQRAFNYAIVDEVDSILIDEARTPLIISGPAEGSIELYVQVDRVIPRLRPEDYEVDEKMRTVFLTEDGQEHVEQLLREDGILDETVGLYDAQNITLVHHVSQALKAHKVFSRDTDYIVKDDKVIIIDEFTGRMMEGRRYSDGLHQALEAKERVKIQNENQTLASITFQNYFRLYPKLSGMTGTAMTEASEFMEIYKLDVVEMPTNVPVQRIDHNDRIYKSLQEKEDAIVDLIRECRDRQQPALVGTVSIEKSEQLSARLTKAKIPHQVLNARYHEQEAAIVAQAGRPGAVTIATNMAGRGTDIQLGGNFEMRVEQEVPADLPEEERARRIDAIRSEIARDREVVRAAGGLYVIGTERHESRRIDNQLRGRAGRQGDPGASAFFISLQDDLMRIFGPERLEALLTNKRVGLRDGEMLTHPWLSKALQIAQSRVEGHNFEIRKNLLKYDNVMNDQRKAIYEQRREILDSRDVTDFVTDMRHDVIETLVMQCIPPNAYAEQWDVTTLHLECQRLLGLDLPVQDWAKEEGIAESEIVERVIDASDRKIAAKAANVGPDIFRQVQKSILIRLLDQNWKDHLHQLDHLRQGINLRAFGQKDPLNEFRTEAFALFEGMLDRLRETVTQSVSLVEINIDPGVLERLMETEQAPRSLTESRVDPADVFDSQDDGADDERSVPMRNDAVDPADPQTWRSTPRNAPCPCGSGEKYKHCHGRVA